MTRSLEREGVRGADPGATRVLRGVIGAAGCVRLVDAAKASSFAVVAVTATNSSFTVGALAMCASVPVVLLGPHIGVLIDRRSPLRTSIIALCLQLAILSVVLVVWVASSLPVLVLLFSAALMLAACQAITDNSLNALLPEVVPDGRLARANGTMTTIQSAARVAGPAIFGALAVYSVTLLLVSWLIVSGLALVILASSFRGARGLVGAPGSGAVPLAAHRGMSWKDGFKWIAESGAVSSLLLCVTLANVALGAMAAVLPLFAVHEIGIDRAAYGLGSSLMALFGIAGSGLIAAVGDKWSERITLPFARILQTLGLILLAGAASSVSFFAAMAVIGLGSGIWNVVSSTCLMAWVPPSLRGRVMATYRSVAFAGSPVGNVLGGAGGGIDSTRGDNTVGRFLSGCNDRGPSHAWVHSRPSRLGGSDGSRELL